MEKEKEKTIDGMTEDEMINRIINHQDSRDEFFRNFIPSFLAKTIIERRRLNIKYDRDDQLIMVEDVDDARNIAEKTWVCTVKSAVRADFKEKFNKD